MWSVVKPLPHSRGVLQYNDVDARPCSALRCAMQALRDANAPVVLHADRRNDTDECSNWGARSYCQNAPGQGRRQERHNQGAFALIKRIHVAALILGVHHSDFIQGRSHHGHELH